MFVLPCTSSHKQVQATPRCRTWNAGSILQTIDVVELRTWFVPEGHRDADKIFRCTRFVGADQDFGVIMDPSWFEYQQSDATMT